MVVYDQDIETEILVGESEWRAVNMTIERSRYNEIDTVKMVSVPDPDENPEAVPVEGQDFVVRLGPRSSVTKEGERDIVDDDLLVTAYSGYVSNVFDFGDGSWQIEAVNYLRELKTTNVYFSVEDYVKKSQVVKEIIKYVNRVENIDLAYEVDLSGSSETPYGTDRFHASDDADSDTDGLIAREFTGETAAEILDHISEASNATWWVDSRNTVYFGPTKTAKHKLSWVTETSAGKQTPPYKSVKVIGDNIVSNEGWNKAQMLSESTGFSERTLEGLGVENELVGSGGLTPPTYTYRNEGIKTQEEAENVANRLLNELQQQQSGGNVTIVGRPMIDILDVIEMPDSFARTSTSPEEDAEFIPAAQYFVQKVTHTLNGRDGFTTKIECAGIAGRYEGPVYELDADGNIFLETTPGQIEEGEEEDTTESEGT